MCSKPGQESLNQLNDTNSTTVCDINGKWTPNPRDICEAVQVVITRTECKETSSTGTKHVYNVIFR